MSRTKRNKIPLIQLFFPYYFLLFSLCNELSNEPAESVSVLQCVKKKKKKKILTLRVSVLNLATITFKYHISDC